ncbi:GNAT family N-acetyltransferase [Pseudonocardia humida]|uniref:GNAT family N-acetyltransferase n=1 Tax=Pseudonocardia humida TaxID=2800819 RepID=UPI00207C927D|nr:GNAT family N-acetyltransferase [Pseudonocardia humida]
MRIGGDLIGRRVALRFRIGERDGRPLYRDAVGELSADGDELVVSTRKGPVRAARTAVVAVRAVPPAVPRRAPLAAVTRLEELCADAWPAVVDRPLGGWRLRAAGGYTGRANSALAVGDPGMPVAAALDVLRGFAVEHAIPARVQAPIGSPWDAAVAREGWVLDSGHEAGAEVSVMVADLAALPRRPGPVVEVPERPSAQWWGLGGDGEPSPAKRHVLDPGGSPRTAFLLARGADGEPVGRLRATAVADHLHLSVLDVLPTERRKGLATTLVGVAADWGGAAAARWAVLQVALHNTGARALYGRLGFVEHHRYRYLVPPS